jgi:hypothetical protein
MLIPNGTPEAPAHFKDQRDQIIWQLGFLAGQADAIAADLAQRMARIAILEAAGAQEPQMLDPREDAESIEEGNVR